LPPETAKIHQIGYGIGRDKVSVHLHPNQLPEETRQTVARH